MTFKNLFYLTYLSDQQLGERSKYNIKHRPSDGTAAGTQMNFHMYMKRIKMLFIYIYVHICVCLCVSVCVRVGTCNQ